MSPNPPECDSELACVILPNAMSLATSGSPCMGTRSRGDFANFTVVRGGRRLAG
jgi:hypothetical protein